MHASISDSWEEAVGEWEIFDCEEDSSLSESCVCGKERLKFLFTIKNVHNDNYLYPIGSSCINKFNRLELSDEAEIQESMFKLLHAVETNTYLKLESPLFSRKLLKALYEEGALDNEYNHYNGYNDYEFLLRMFNKRNKEDITYRQQRKINGILAYSIRPFLVERLSSKIIYK